MKSLADKDGQIQALEERMLGMEEEIARKDIAITNLSGRVKSLHNPKNMLITLPHRQYV